jgi:hypothetical protein
LYLHCANCILSISSSHCTCHGGAPLLDIHACMHAIVCQHRCAAFAFVNEQSHCPNTWTDEIAESLFQYSCPTSRKSSSYIRSP